MSISIPSTTSFTIATSIVVIGLTTTIVNNYDWLVAISDLGARTCSGAAHLARCSTRGGGVTRLVVGDTWLGSGFGVGRHVLFVCEMFEACEGCWGVQ
jgi:hypothetical protein